MADPIVMSRSIRGELPFSLNLPEGNYRIELDGVKYQVELLQNRIAVFVDADAFMVGKASDLQAQLSEVDPIFWTARDVTLIGAL